MPIFGRLARLQIVRLSPCEARRSLFELAAVVQLQTSFKLDYSCSVVEYRISRPPCSELASGCQALWAGSSSERPCRTIQPLASCFLPFLPLSNTYLQTYSKQTWQQATTGGEHTLSLFFLVRETTESRRRRCAVRSTRSMALFGGCKSISGASKLTPLLFARYYKYDVNRPLAIAAVVVFFVAFLGHVGFMARYRSWYVSTSLSHSYPARSKHHQLSLTKAEC